MHELSSVQFDDLNLLKIHPSLGKFQLVRIINQDQIIFMTNNDKNLNPKSYTFNERS